MEQKRGVMEKAIPLVVLVVCMLGAFWIGFDRGQTVSGQGYIPNNVVLANRTHARETVDFGLFWKAWDLLQEKYVDKGSINTQDMMYGAIKGMFASAGDPYTTFFDPEENKAFQEEISGSFQGIGAEIGMKDGIVSVVAPLDDSPAQKAGIRSGDKIIKIDGVSTLDMNLQKAVSLIRGEKGTEVMLTLFRDSEDQNKEITVRRDTITVISVKSEDKGDGIALIKVSRFGDEENEETTADIFQRKLDTILAQKPQGIILDLRNNPGGYLDAAVSMASLMIPKGKIILMEENSDGNRKQILARGGDIASEVQTVVLINEGSASASEILSGALKDNRSNVTLVGKTSFGKGSVQEPVALTKDTLAKITVAKWLTPQGKQINHEGITPDIEVSLSADDFKNDRDPQLDKALEILRGKM